MTQHTKGPWHRNIKPARRYPVVFAGRNTHVAIVCSEGLSEAEVEANCDLITAVPELIAALQRMVALYDTSPRFLNPAGAPEVGKERQEALAQAEVALDKAAGIYK